MSRERSYSPGRPKCRQMLVCSPTRSPGRYSTPELVRHNSPGTVGDGRDQSILRAFDMDQLTSELLEEYEPPPFHDIPADASFEEVMCIMASPPSAAPTAAQSLDHLRAEVAQVMERTAAAMSESVAPSVVCPVKASPEVITVPPHPKDPQDVEALVKRARAIAKLKAIEEAKAAAAAAAAPPPPAKRVVKAAPVSRRAPAQKPAAVKPQKAPPKAPQRPPPKVPQKAPPKAVQKAPPKAVQKAPPKAVQKAPPKAVQKAPPKAVQRPPPKVAPKVPPKVPPKAPPKAPQKVPPKVPTKAPPKVPTKAPPKVPQKAPAKIVQKAPPKAPQTAPPKAPARPPPKAPQRGVQKGPALKVPKPGINQKGPTPPGYVPTEYAKAILRTRKLAGIKTVDPKKKTPTPQIVVCPPPSDKITPVDVPEPLVIEATYESVMRRAAALKDKLGLTKAALEAHLAPSRRRLSPYLTDEDQLEEEPEADLEDELDEFETLEELYNATARESLLEPEQASVSVLQDRIAALQQELLPSPPSPVFEVPTILRHQDVGRRREYLAAYAARAGYMRRAELEAEDVEDEEDEEEEYEDEGEADLYPIPISVIPPTPQQQIERPLRARSIFESPTGYPTSDRFDDRLLDALEPPEFTIGDVSPYAFSREAYEDFLCGDIKKGDFSRTDFSQGQETPPIRPTLLGHTPRRKPRPKRKKLDDMIFEGLEQPAFSVSSVSPYAFSQEAYEAYLSGEDSLEGEDLGRIDFAQYDRQITPPPFSPDTSSTPSRFNQAFVEDIDLESSEAEEDLLADTSIPEYDADVSMEERHVGDVTPPDLCDLSLSDTDLALVPDYPDRIEAEAAESPKQQGIITTMVTAIVDRVRNMFSPRDEQLEVGEEDEVNLDVSLPNLFETTPPPKAPTPEPMSVVCEPTQTSAKRISPEGPIRIPPHPKDPKDYQSIVRRAQAIQKQKAKEAAEAAAAAPPPPSPAAKTKKGKKEIKSSIPKRGPPPVKKLPPGKKAPPPGKKGPQPKKKKEEEEEKKVYPPGEYSPSDVRAVARARTLAGFKHYSDLLNPERVAKEKAAQAAREAEMARIELLPPVIRMRKKIELLKDRLPPPGAEVLPRPSIDLLGRLEAIRATLPEEKPKRKWRPTGRLRVDRRVKKPDRIFRKEHGRILIPTKQTQKKKGWKKLDVMSPIEEASPPPPEQLIQFSPLRPEEGRKRLDYLREQAARRAADVQRATEEAEGSIPHLFDESREYGSPELEMGPIINLLSPRTEETRRDKLVTTVGPHGGPETLREEVTETSVIENGEVRTSTRKVTTKTDEFGNVTRHVQEGTGQTGEEEAMPNLEDVEPPDFLDVSDIPPPQDPSIPTPGEIIDRIRANVRQKLQEAIPNVHESPVPTCPGNIDLPQDITDDDLYETIMEFEGSSPEMPSPQQRIVSPIIRDDRLYALGERPPPTPPPPVVCPPSPKATTPPPEPVRPRTPSPAPKPKSPEEIVVPAHPKDPKDYKSIVRRAQAIQKLKKQQEALLAELAPPPPAEPAAGKATKAKKGGRVPISRWVAPPPKDKQKRKHKKLVLKKRAPKVSPKKASPVKEVEEDEDREIPDEPPELSQEYRDAVARARLLHGLKNRTAALNPKVAAKIAAKKAAEEAARAAYEALPENEKIKVRMERLRRVPVEKRQVQASAEVLGTIAAIRANMPPIEEILRQPSPPPPCPSPPREEVRPSPRTPSAHIPRYSPRAPFRERPRSPSPAPSPDETDKSLDDFEYMEQAMGAKPPSPEVCVPVQQEDLDASIKLPDISLLRPYVSPSDQRSPSPVRPRPPSPGRSPDSRTSSPRGFLDLSLAEFENLEEEVAMNLSIDEFEALEAEAQRVDISSLHEAVDPQLYDYTTPTRGERHWGRNLAELFPRSPRDAVIELSDSMGVTEIETSPVMLPPRVCTPPVPWVAAPSMRQLAQQGFFEDQEYLEDEEEIVRPHISPRPGASPGSIYYDPMEGFTVEPEEVVLDTSLLMPETPPKTLKEKLERLKRSTERPPTSPKYVEAAVSPTTPQYEFTPVPLISPSGAPCIVPARTSPISAEGQLLIDIDAPPRRSVRQLRDLEDLPFYGIEYEDEPELQDISFERPITPPPRPEDIVAEMKSRLRDLRGQTRRSPTRTPPMLPMPEEIPDEELMELTAPSFSATPPRTPSPRARERSPRLSPLPMVWGEVRPPTPKTPSPRRPSPVRVPTPTPPRPATPEKLPTPVCVPEEEGPIVIPEHPEDPKDYAAMIRRAQAIYRLKKQEEAEEAAKAPPPEPPKKKGRVPISRWVAPPPKKKPKKPRKKLVMRKRVKPEEKEKTKEPPPPPPEEEEEDREIPAEPPPLDQDYRDAVARARLLHGLKNRTAALNPKVAAKLAARKAAEEAAAAEFAALPEHEKIKVRMERLRKKPRRRQAAKPTMEQLAFLEAMKQVGGYQLTPPSPPRPPTPRISPSARRAQTPPRLSLSPQRRLQEHDELADFEAQEEDIDFQMMEAEAAVEAEGQMQQARDRIEILENVLICPPTVSQENAALQQRIANLEELLETEEMPEEGDVSLAEFEALEAVEAPADVCPPQADVPELDMRQVIADLQSEQLRTPPRIDPREKYRQLLAQRQKTPPSPKISPIKEPEIHYSPVTLSSPSRGVIEKRAEKTTTQVTMSGDNTIQEQLIEKSEIVNGELQQVTTHVTTTTDANGTVRCQINESKRIAARDPSAELEDLPPIEDVDEPSFLDTTPISPMERPRPRDIIERVKKQVKERYVPHVPTGQLIELRTPPRELPLPEDITEEELLEYSFAELEEETPDEAESPVRTPVRDLDLSIPRVFEATPPPPTPPPRPVSPLRHRIPSPEGPIEIPPHPGDPQDYRAICRRARKIQEFRAKEEEELRAAEEAAAAAAAAEAAKPKKKVRVPISRWTAPPPKKQKKRKKLVMKKRDEAAQPTAAPPPAEEEYPDEPPPLPEHFAEEVARARMLAGIKKKPPPHSPIKDFSTLQSRLASLREKGVVPKAQPSLASAAYLNAIKRAMHVRQQIGPSEGEAYESPKSRYQRILAERAACPPPAEESPIRTPPREDIPYIPVRFVSPRVQGDLLAIPEVDEDYALDMSALEDLEDLAELQEPSLVDVSQYLSGEEEDIDITPPSTPPPRPAEIISRIREQYQHVIQRPESPHVSPTQLEFPEDLPEEELLELSGISLAASPPRVESPVRSPDISFPRYFERTPPPKLPTPPARSVSPGRKTPKAGSPGVRVKTPEGPLQIPPHPTDPTDVAAMIRRARMIQQLQAKEAAEKPVEEQPKKKVREPISKRTAPPPKKEPKPHKKGRLFRPLKLKKKAPPAPAAAPPSPREIPKEPPKLPEDYVSEVNRARKLAGLKTKVALPEAERPPADYASIMERITAMRAAKQEMQQGPTARELTTRQHLKNRQQRQERKRLLQELERIRAQQGYQEPIELAPVRTPPPARERLRAIKERTPPQILEGPCSPVKTPEQIDMPAYRPIMLPPTPPCLFLQNVEVPEVADLSVCEFVEDDYDTTVDESEIEDYQFQVAEAEAAQAALSDTEYELASEIQIQSDFDMAKRLQNLEYQLIDQIAEEEDLEFQMIEAAAAAEVEAAQAEAAAANRIEILENVLLAPPRTQCAEGFTNTQAVDVRSLIQVAENILMAPPTGYSPPTTSAAARERIQLEQRLKALQQHLQQCEQRAATQYMSPVVSEYDDSIDEFEALENECR